MYREFVGSMDLNVSHDISGIVNIKRYDNLKRIEEDQNLTSKIEINFNNRRGFLK